jgi:hypothetical protein
VLNGSLRNLKDNLWLWESCNKVLGDPIYCEARFSDSERKSALRDAIYAPRTSDYVLLVHYPPCPTTPLPSSGTVDALRAVLDRAPTAKRRQMILRIKRHDDMFTGNCSWSWSEEYLGKLLTLVALIDVLREYGTGDDEWKNVRWEVYDKVCSEISVKIFKSLTDIWSSTLNVWAGSTIVDFALTITSVGSTEHTHGFKGNWLREISASR